MIKVTKIGLICCILIFAINSVRGQTSGQIKTDTSFIIEDCLEKTIIKQAGKTRTSTNILACFWESGTDTTQIIEDYIEKTIISKKGYTRTFTKKLDCY